MHTEWIGSIPDVIVFILGLGGFAGALLLVVKLWREFVPDADTALSRDVSAIRSDLHDVRTRVGMLEVDIAKIDHPGITRRFDTIEKKIDRLNDLLVERLARIS